MKVAAGTVIDGKVVVDGDALEEGSRVTVVVSDESDFELTAAQSAELASRLGAVLDGDFVEGDEFIAQHLR